MSEEGRERRADSEAITYIFLLHDLKKCRCCIFIPVYSFPECNCRYMVIDSCVGVFEW